MTLVVHALVLINIDSDMHGDEIKILRFSLPSAVYFIMLPFFGSCIIHILHTGCAKI